MHCDGPQVTIEVRDHFGHAEGAISVTGGLRSGLALLAMAYVFNCKSGTKVRPIYKGLGPRSGTPVQVRAGSGPNYYG